VAHLAHFLERVTAKVKGDKLSRFRRGTGGTTWVDGFSKDGPVEEG